MTRVIRCAFCSWSTPVWRTRADGARRGPDAAWRRLAEHIEHAHPDQAEKLAEDLTAWDERHAPLEEP